MFKNISVLLVAAILSGAVMNLSASELSLQGTAPLVENSTLGFGVFFGSDLTGAMDTENMSVEFFWRSKIVDALDWGISVAPMTTDNFPGTPDINFDTKTRLFKGSGFLPSLIIGVNLIKFTAVDPSDLNLSATLLDEGRAGLSWEYTTVKTDSEGRAYGEVKRNNIYLGVDVTPGGSNLGNRYYIGVKFSSLNLMVIYTDQLNSAGISYCF